MSKIVHPEFAMRFLQACDTNPNVPPVNYGRLKWFVEQFEHRFGDKFTIETIRKWISGETRPREDPMRKLAILLDVEPAWLSLGEAAEISKKEAKLRDATADGCVNLIAGLVQMCGGHPAFPSAADRSATDNTVDLFAIIRGAKYAFHVVVSRNDGDKHRFFVPARALPHCIVIGVRWTSMSDFSLYELDQEVLTAKGKTKAGSYEVSPEDGFRQIVTFSNRL